MAAFEAALEAGDGEGAFAIVRRPAPATWPERERVRWDEARTVARILAGWRSAVAKR